MLQLNSISKQYQTGDDMIHALNQVSITFRDSEFVSILGPSGSGKTTLLNIIGGLDRYSSGDLLISGVSTKQYKDQDWDSYRNHAIGFVFQSYHLIPHQSVLSNVELALTLSGVSHIERRKRAIDVLNRVGLSDQIYKKPNQLSGGQMQRVAIARALINNPDILLADEPTGALDTETSIQIMDLLHEVANDRLVIMVTHNPELAETYSSRIIRLKDGKVIDDSAPFLGACELPKRLIRQKKNQVNLSFLTSLSLSFQNLRTKKGRTLLTSFAGSIGIIGIALILSLSNGVNAYIAEIQKDTMTSYPITIDAESTEITSMMRTTTDENEPSQSQDMAVYADVGAIESKAQADASVKKNNLTEFKAYLDDPQSDIHSYVGENGIVYSYDTNFDVYAYDQDGTIIDCNETTSMEEGRPAPMAMMNASSTTQNFEQLMPGKDGETLSPVITDNYRVLYGSWPQAYNDVILVLDENNELPLETLYQLGFITMSEYSDLSTQIRNGETPEERKWAYEDLCDQRFYLVPASDQYVQNEQGYFDMMNDDASQKLELVQNGIELNISGIVRLNEDANQASITSSVAYSYQLTQYLMDEVNQSPVVLAQEEHPDINVLTGNAFSSDDAITGQTYEDNMKAFGKVSQDHPTSISIYADRFEDKEQIANCIETYNETVSEENQIIYTDFVAMLIGSITSIINAISYILIAFVGVSLFVSCMMIGIITHISVMERTKEIGILRALGASKRSIANVFIAETFIIGLCAGLLGVGLSMLCTIPINAILQLVFGIETLSASLPLPYAIVLIFISIVITIIGGLIPARNASKKDPVIALRTE